MEVQYLMSCIIDPDTFNSSLIFLYLFVKRKIKVRSILGFWTSHSFILKIQIIYQKIILRYKLSIKAHTVWRQFFSIKSVFSFCFSLVKVQLYAHLPHVEMVAAWYCQQLYGYFVSGSAIIILHCCVHWAIGRSLISVWPTVSLKEQLKMPDRTPVCFCLSDWNPFFPLCLEEKPVSL